ncbi:MULTISPECIES: 3-isopropylmalate dehydratase large subunit [Novosphingobium]|jgi:3-isopropylmalate/(R)-2-methylmalate dehydratase large subunit|uniref:3-isopropylmalate dehydratase large subunit n=1 Tax=Novosphingobium TaxID=165696 RepID=UPI0022F25ED6|nr:3-isopropylmalate dehydratase large subunit [Novosphingobium resinovorum]GLK46085.1 3-isopropylmalate dehydratase large subunit 1 [Novosphingobium resinovorum]
MTEGPLTLAEKIWSAHRVMTLESGAEVIAIDRLLLHERTGGVALKSLEEAGRTVMHPSRVFATMDHIVDTFPGRTDKTLMPTGTAFIVSTRESAKRHGITLFDIDDPRQGIVHVVSPEQGIILPGAILVCPDSHTCTQGAFGGLAWGIGSSEAEHVLATMTLRMNRPPDMRVTIDGVLGEGVTAKDLALHLIAALGSNGAKGHIIEFAGSAVRALDMEARMTLCNMATEMACAGAVIAPDDKTFDWLEGRPYAPKGEVREQAIAAWRALYSDDGAVFATEHRFDAAEVRPMVTWGNSPQHAAPLGAPVPADALSKADQQRAVEYMAVTPGEPVEGLPIDAAFIGSCTNSRISDLRRAAAILKGRKVAEGVKAICVPGSTQVKAAAEAEGLHEVFLDAGFEWREAGCSMCFFAGGESFAPEARVISSTNRNFESRQGPNTRTHLASPETVAASAIAGRIALVSEIAA